MIYRPVKELINKGRQFLAEYLLRAGKYLSPESHEASLRDSSLYKQSEANCARIAGYAGDLEGRCQNLDNQNTTLKAQLSSMNFYEGEVQRSREAVSKLQKESNALINRNTQLALDQVGLTREIRDLKGMLAPLEEENRRLKLSGRKTLRKHYTEGVYRKRAILITGEDSVVSIQNPYARKILGNFEGIKLSDYFSLRSDKPHLARIGEQLYSFEVTPLNGGYEIQVEKASRWHQQAKVPGVSEVPTIKLPQSESPKTNPA